MHRFLSKSCRTQGAAYLQNNVAYLPVFTVLDQSHIKTNTKTKKSNCLKMFDNQLKSARTSNWF